MENNIFNDFKFAVFRVVIKALDPLLLPPYKGSAIRGCFGHSFRKAICLLHHKACTDCPMVNRCFYAYAFETIRTEHDEFIRNNGEVPRPYIIRPALDTRTEYMRGDELSFDFVLIGKAIEYFIYFAYSFINMGQLGIGRGKGRFAVQSIDAFHLPGQWINIYRMGQDTTANPSRFTLTAGELIADSPMPPEQCTVCLQTPFEINMHGAVKKIDFGIFFRTLLRRITELSYLHCGIDCRGFDFNALCTAAYDIQTEAEVSYETAARYSNRQHRKHPFNGFKGNLTFKGNLEPFWFFLLLGQWIHIGKKTTFGFGRYEVLQHFTG